MGIRGRKVSKELETIICEKYINGATLASIAERSHISQTTVLSILRRNNIPLRNGKRLSVQQEEEVVKLYRDGASIIEIKEKTVAKSEQTIYRILRDFGVERRKKWDTIE